MSHKRVLFVDDDELQLKSLRRVLSLATPDWAPVFTSDPDVALAAISGGEVDVLVTDMRMPEVSGLDLLQAAYRANPQIIRIAISGYTEQAVALRAIPVTHQFLSKPTKPSHLIDSVERACALQELLGSEALAKLVGRVDSLPALPTVYAELSQAVGKTDTSLGELAAIVEKDLAISARVLQVVNSAFFGLPQKTASITHAVSYIGANMLANLVLSIEVFSLSTKAQQALSLAEMRDHALMTAAIAARLCDDQSVRQDAFMGGMLHDVGKLILADLATDEFLEISAESEQRGVLRAEVERERYGVTHAEVGAYLMGLWGMPYPIVETIARHHEKRDHERTSGEVGVADAVYLADRFVNLAMEHEDYAQAFIDELDPVWLASVGGEDRIQRWLHAADSVLRGS